MQCICINICLDHLYLYLYHLYHLYHLSNLYLYLHLYLSIAISLSLQCSCHVSGSLTGCAMCRSGVKMCKELIVDQKMLICCVEMDAAQGKFQNTSQRGHSSGAQGAVNAVPGPGTAVTQYKGLLWPTCTSTNSSLHSCHEFLGICPGGAGRAKGIFSLLLQKRLSLKSSRSSWEGEWGWHTPCGFWWHLGLSGPLRLFLEMDAFLWDLVSPDFIFLGFHVSPLQGFTLNWWGAEDLLAPCPAGAGAPLHTQSVWCRLRGHFCPQSGPKLSQHGALRAAADVLHSQAGFLSRVEVHLLTWEPFVTIVTFALRQEPALSILTWWELGSAATSVFPARLRGAQGQISGSSQVWRWPCWSLNAGRHEGLLPFCAALAPVWSQKAFLGWPELPFPFLNI